MQGDGLATFLRRKKRWFILALPIVAVLMLWVAIHFRVLFFDWAIGPLRVHSTLAGGELISNGLLEIRPLSEYLVVPEVSVEVISYEEKAERMASGGNTQCFYATEAVETPPLDPFQSLPLDPFSDLHNPGPGLKTTLFGSAATIDGEFSGGLGFYHATIPLWMVLLVAIIPISLFTWKKREQETDDEESSIFAALK